MEARASLPVTLPVSDPTFSYWQEPPDAEIADRGIEDVLPRSADVVVIGSGISGANIAWGLLEEGVEDVVMLEARQACSGATGRNGGHTKAASYRSFFDNLTSLGAYQASQIARLEYNCIITEQNFIKEHNIDCDLFCCDTVDIIYDPVFWDQAVRSIKLMQHLMPDDIDGAAKYTIHSATDARETFLCAGEGWTDGKRGGQVQGAISYPAGSMSAYKFVIGVLKMSLEKGLKLFTHTPALKVERSRHSNDWIVETSRGSIRAKMVVLATNAYTGYLCSEFKGSIVPVRGQITAQRPGRNMPQKGLRETYSFVYEKGYDYMITRQEGARFEGDIVVGGGWSIAEGEGLAETGISNDDEINADVSAYLRGSLERVFGENWGEDHEDGRVRREWTGIMGYSSDSHPFVGKVPGKQNLFISAGFQGHGMVMCFLCAKALVQIMVRKVDQSVNGLGRLREWFPFVYTVSEERINMSFEGRV